MSSITPELRKHAAPRSRLWFAGVVLHPRVLPLLLIVLLAATAGALAYQATPTGRVAVGWLGDRLFLDSYSGQSGAAVNDGAFYPDDLTPDAPTGRSRWTREYARITLPNVGTGSPLDLTLLLQGWPNDVLDAPLEGTTVNAGSVQPEVTVTVNGRTLTTLVPSPDWQTYTIPLPANRAGGDVQIELATSATFTDTERGADARPKGVRLAAVEVNAAQAGMPLWLPPVWESLLLLALTGLLLYLLIITLLRSEAASFVLTMFGIGLAAVGLALARIWMGAALTVVIGALAIGLLVAWHQPLLAGVRALIHRYNQGHALAYGLVALAVAWAVYLAGRAITLLQQGGGTVQSLLQQTFPDSLLAVGVLVGVLVLVLILGRDGLPRIADSIAASLGGRWVAPALLVGLGALWLGNAAWAAFRLPYVGHADYADNAVVARNLVAGRGWVVDYVSQFYYLYDGLTRPQETWPLLQPVWIAPFIAAFGDSAWAVKMPNLLFSIALLLLVYVVGSHIWDRRVGLTAALLTVTNYLFFNLMLYATSDLAFVVFAMAAMYLMYRVIEHEEQGNTRQAWYYLVAAAVATGLMMLQKPVGGLIAVGIGLWYLAHTLRPDWGQVRRVALRFTVWAGLAMLVLSPYLVRNVVVFGKPVFSTESYDAWVLGYRGDSGDAWSDIYRVYTPELGGDGLPDRSWVLRWGFDYTWAKFETQVQAMRDYLMPAMPEQAVLLTNSRGDPLLWSRTESRNLLMAPGAWLALIGVLAALRSRRRLLTLLVMSYSPYIVLLLTYWRTNEERYFLMVIPWLLLLAAWVLWAAYERIAAIGNRRLSPLALLLVFATIAVMLQPSWQRISGKLTDEPGKWAPDIAAYAWVADTLPADTVLMTRNPWQLNWHTERAAVMIPNTPDPATFAAIAEHYSADYLIFENLQRVKGDAADLLAPLADARDAQVGDVIHGYEVVYASPTPTERVLIYRFPEADR